MDSSSIFLMLIVIFILLMNDKSRKKNRMRLKLRKRRQKENQSMDYQLVKAYEGKLCIITTDANSLGGIIGTITKVTDGWIEVESTKSTEILNLDYVSSIKLKMPKPLKK